MKAEQLVAVLLKHVGAEETRNSLGAMPGKVDRETPADMHAF